MGRMIWFSRRLEDEADIRQARPSRQPCSRPLTTTRPVVGFVSPLISRAKVRLAGAVEADDADASFGEIERQRLQRDARYRSSHRRLRNGYSI